MYQIIELGPELRVFKLKCDFDASAVAEHSLKDVFEDLAENWDGDVELDLSEVAFMDSSGIGAIVFLFKRLSSSSRKLFLSGAGEQPMRLIEMLRLQKSIPVRMPSCWGDDNFGQAPIWPAS